MIVIGLTGSIATGKSTVVGWLRELGIHVNDADASVHHMFKHDARVITAIEKLWPDCIDIHGVDRKALGRKVLHNPQATKKLESITHPIVREYSQKFLAERNAAGDPVVFLDIPLLFEGGMEKTYDATLVVYCSPENQRARALARGADADLFDYLTSQQIPMDEKVKKADFKLNTDGTLAETKENLLEVLHLMETKFNIKLIKG
jgi:dephospho-CoA kinase